MKRVLAAVLAAAMVFALGACGVSSSSTSTTTVSSSVTDGDGNTTTNSVTNETGVSVGTDGVSASSDTTTETTTGSEDPDFTAEDLEAVWYQRFSGGAEGISEYGDVVYFAFDDPDDISYAIIMLITDEGETLFSREGAVTVDDDGNAVLTDEEMDSETPFSITDADGDTFTMNFIADGDSAEMTVLDLDSIIGDMIAVWSEFME